VCHQAANRILLPAGITVRGARGYGVSEALFGTYGRPRGAFGTCRAPFRQHPGIVGDLPGCPAAAAKAAGRASERRYLRGVLAIYRRARPLFKPARPSGPDLERFQVALFMHQVRHALGPALGRTRARKLREIRRSTERSRMKLEDWLAAKELTVAAFVDAFNQETLLFQEAVAGILTARQYEALFGLPPGETVILAGPRIVRRAYGPR
jgi:hypothetical protein